MAKVSGALYVLKVLLAGDIVKGDDLAIDLKCSKRQIRSYINNLKSIGVDVKSKTGNNGGYYLNTDKCPLCKNNINKYY